eukprot:COSAG02_NODE_1577_length_11862_cov_13.243135_2_plen_92_part_00
MAPSTSGGVLSTRSPNHGFRNRGCHPMVGIAIARKWFDNNRSILLRTPLAPPSLSPRQTNVMLSRVSSRSLVYFVGLCSLEVDGELVYCPS